MSLQSQQQTTTKTRRSSISLLISNVLPKFVIIKSIFSLPSCSFPLSRKGRSINMVTTKLTKAMHLNDITEFHSILSDKSWTRDLEPLDYEQLLHKAFKLGRRRMTKLLLKKNQVVKNTDKNIYNALLHMIVKKYGRSSSWYDNIVKLLDKFHPRIAHRDEAGNTAVHLAFLNYTGDRLMDILLKRYLEETNENIVNKDGLSLLHIVCTRSVDAIERLCSGRNVDMNCQISLNSESIHAGYSPLHFAVEYGKFNIAEYLLKQKASVNVQDANGSTPLHLACYRRDIGMIDLIHSYDDANKNVKDNFGLTHFMTACTATDPLLAKKYLILAEISSETTPAVLINDQVKDLDTFPYGGYTPLHFAAEFGRIKTVKLLLEHGAISDVLTTEKLSPLALAREHEHKVICFYLKDFKRENKDNRDVIESEKNDLDVNMNELLSSSRKISVIKCNGICVL